MNIITLPLVFITVVTVTEAQFEPNIPALYLTFTAAVNTSSINCENAYFALRSSLENTSVSYSIYAVRSCAQFLENEIQYQISPYVLDDLVYYYHDAIFESDDPALEWSDLSYNEDIIIPSGVLPVTIIDDDIRPTVVQFNLDMNAGYICLLFDSPISYRSLNDTPIFFSNPLQMGSVQAIVLPYPFNNDFMICSDLSLENLTILQTHEVCIDTESCFIYFSEDFVTDPFSNPVFPIPQENSLMVSLCQTVMSSLN